MPIVSTDIVLLYTTTSGAAGNSTAGTQAGSLGKYVSTTPVATGVNGLFDDISGAENQALTVDYRGIGVLDNHATLALQNAVIYIASEVAGGASVAVAVDNIAVSAKGSASAQLAQIANETTAPTGVGTFSSPTTAAAGLALGTIPAGSVRGIWAKRTAANTSALDADGVTLGISGDTSQ